MFGSLKRDAKEHLNDKLKIEFWETFHTGVLTPGREIVLKTLIAYNQYERVLLFSTYQSIKSKLCFITTLQFKASLPCERVPARNVVSSRT